MNRRVVVFVFAGRKRNMEIQLPLIRRVLQKHSNVEYHIWSLTRIPDDATYLRSIIRDNRIWLREDFIGEPWWMSSTKVYAHYARKEYTDCLFVKFDDDVLFMQTHRFAAFIDAVDANRGSVVSAKIINNGASTLTEPKLFDRFAALNIPLREVDESTEYATISHDYMFAHWRELLDQQIMVVPSNEWLSINAIGYDWETGRRIACGITGVNRGDGFNDEGAVNTLPRMIVQGFLCAHLTFSRQYPTDEQRAWWREQYALIGKQYLAEQS